VEPLQGTLLTLAPDGGPPAIDPGAAWTRRALDERCWVDLSRGWLRGADALLVELVEQVEWQQRRRRMYDRVLDDPRLSRWYGRDAEPPHPALPPLRAALEARYAVPFGGPALNYYRDGRDSVAPHGDRELRTLDCTLVAILTLGARRPFLVRPRGGGSSIDLAPGSGDLLVMGGATQLHWEHAVPKVARCGPRVSVSWRWSAGA
jgi:alkylated DNA repair dioxygenase AlkB